MGAICALLVLLSWAGGGPMLGSGQRCWCWNLAWGALQELCAVLSGQPLSALCLCTQCGEHT